jgi:hypothetical protein
MITRKTAVVQALVFMPISGALFVLNPLPPYGKYAAFSSFLFAVCSAIVAIFPRVALRIGTWMGKDNADHLGRWVP